MGFFGGGIIEETHPDEDRIYPEGPGECICIGTLHVIRIVFTLVACFSGPIVYSVANNIEASMKSEISNLQERINDQSDEIAKLTQILNSYENLVAYEDEEFSNDRTQQEAHTILVKSSLNSIENAYNDFLFYENYLLDKYEALISIIDKNDETIDLVDRQLEDMLDPSLDVAPETFSTQEDKVTSIETLSKNINKSAPALFVMNCAQSKSILKKTSSGIHQVNVNGKRAFVKCAMRRDSIYLVFEQRKYDRTVNFAEKQYEEYQTGFGSFIAYGPSFFMGLDFMHEYTTVFDYDVSFDQICDLRHKPFWKSYNKIWHTSGIDTYRGLRIGSTRSSYEFYVDGTINGQEHAIYMAQLPAKFYQIGNRTKHLRHHTMCGSLSNFQGFWLDVGCVWMKPPGHGQDFAVWHFHDPFIFNRRKYAMGVLKSCYTGYSLSHMLDLAILVKDKVQTYTLPY